MTSRTERFQRKPKEKEKDIPVEEEEIIRFSPEQEAKLLEESNAQKAVANKLFTNGGFKDAIETYDKALECCPNYLDYEIAVLKSNVAACYLKLEDWKEAVKAATASLDKLDKLEGVKKEEGGEKVEEEADEEIVSAGAVKAQDTSDKGKREMDIERIRTKALMRRGRARSELGGWSSLQGAEEDYKTLSEMKNLSPADRKIVQKQMIALPPRTKAAQEKEMGEMMGKLKELGNGILKPFGLSTDNFQMVKDENTGGYSMNFNQNPPTTFPSSATPAAPLKLPFFKPASTFAHLHSTTRRTMSGTSTPNPRFTPQASTAEDVLRTQTEGLVALSDFRKRRAEAIELKSQEAHGDGASTPKEPSSSGIVKKKKKRKVAGTPKLSFGDDEDNDGGDSASDITPASTRSATPVPKSKPVNASVGVVPKALTKSALLREAQTRETLRKEFLAIQEQVKAQEIAIPFVFYDGTDIPGGTVRVKKGDFIWVFLDKSRKVGAEMGVGRGNTNREWARVGVDDLMVVRGGLIIPHHYEFYYFVINHTLGPNNRVLFDYSSSPPSTPSTTSEPAPALNLDTYDPLSRPSDKAKAAAASVKEDEKKELEGAKDDPSFTKVVDRRWYERNKHIFPASVWQEFDPEKDYQREVKRDAGGNAFFFS